MRHKYLSLLALSIALGACGTIPTEFTWDEVIYHRKGQDVTVELKGRAELNKLDLGDIF